jgi:hypothetical protein
MHIENDPSKTGRNEELTVRYTESEDYGSLSDSVDRVHFEAYGSEGSLRPTRASIMTPGLGAKGVAKSVRHELLNGGVALEGQRSGGQGVSVQFGSVSKDADDEPYMTVSYKKDDITAFRLGKWAEENLAKPVTIEHNTGYRSATSHKATFEGGAVIEIDLDADPAYMGKPAHTAIQEDSFAELGYARAVQGLGHRGRAIDQIASDVVANIPGEKEGLKEAVSAAVSAKYDEIEAEVAVEIENNTVLSNAVAVLAGSGKLGRDDAAAIVNDQIDNHGTSFWDVSVEPRDKDRVQAYGLKDPNDDEKIVGEVKIDMPDALSGVTSISAIREEYYPSADDKGNTITVMHTSIHVPLRSEGAIVEHFGDAVVSTGDVVDHEANITGTRVSIKGSITEVTAQLAEAGLLPQVVSDELNTKGDLARASYDGVAAPVASAPKTKRVPAPA